MLRRAGDGFEECRDNLFRSLIPASGDPPFARKGVADESHRTAAKLFI